MRIHIQKWGNSLALRIPKAFAEEAHIHKGSDVEATVKNGKILLTPLEEVKYNLKKLLSKVSSKNMHSEEDFGPAVGKELL